MLSAVKAAIFTEGFVTDLTAEDMGRQLAAKREQLKQLQRAGCRPGVTRVREQDVFVALGNLRELLEGNVGVAAQVLKALVGDVVIEARPVEGRRSPEMVATFTIDGIQAFTALDRGRRVRADDPTVGLWEFLNADRWIIPARPGARDEPERLYPPALNSAALGRRAGL